MTPSQNDPDSGPSSNTLQATVHTASKMDFRGQVAAAQHRVVTIEFARDGAPNLPIAEELTVSFRSREVFDPFAARSRVIFRQDDSHRSRYKFEVSERDGQTLNALFKRRASARMRSDEEVVVEVREAGMKIAPYLECRLRDISKSGMSLRVASQVETQLCSMDRLELRFHLPGDDALFDLMAGVRYRQLLDECVHYGLEFERTPGDAAGRIEAYIQRRQREIIQLALGSSWMGEVE